MQRDTTLASTKVGAPVLKLIVVFPLNRQLPTLPAMRPASYSCRRFKRGEMKLRGERAHGG